MRSENGGTLVEVRDLAKTFRGSNGKVVEAVKGVSLDIRQGEVFSLLGPNGAGKTTTISMISGLLAPTRGDARIGGFSITRQALEAKKLLGVVPQEIALYLTLSARQNLEFFGRMYGMAGAALAHRVDEILDFIDLTDRQHDKVETFSGGMKRRVNIGVGLMHKPRLLYMDEPTVGIDPQNRRRVLDTVQRLQKEQGMTVLYTSHLMEEVQEISDRIAIIDHGQVIANGTLGELIQQIGEEDRIFLKVGAQPVVQEQLSRLQTAVTGVTKAAYSRRDIAGDDGVVVDVDGVVTVLAKRGRRALPPLLQAAEDAGITVLSVEVREPDLEAVFLELTGRALRD
jgi:ABC-2 type transport system ATP-binding protein